MVMFTFSVSERKYYFWANLVQKIKIVKLCWNLVPGLIRIYNSMVTFNFSAVDRQYLVWANMVLFEVCEIRW